MRVAGHLDAVEDARDGLNLDVPLQLACVDSGVSQDFLVGCAVGLKITQQKVLEEGEELIALKLRLRGQCDSLLRDIPTLQQLDNQRIDFLRRHILHTSLFQAIDDIMLPQLLTKNSPNLTKQDASPNN